MNWILGVISIALIVILIQLAAIYSKRSNELRLRQEPLRRRIQFHRREIAASAEKVQRAADDGLEELEFSITALVDKNAQLKKGVEELEQQVRGNNEDEEEIEDKDPVAMAALKEDDPRLVLRDVIRRREELESHVNALKRDAEGIKRNMQRVHAKLTRAEGGKGKK